MPYLVKKGDWELWGSTHPITLGCLNDERQMCSCKYHLVNQVTKEIISYNSYPEVAQTFKEKTGEEPITIK